VFNLNSINKKVEFMCSKEIWFDLFSCCLGNHERNSIHMPKSISVFVIIFRIIDFNFKWNLIHKT
jgi:hypothetical protein